MNKLIGIRDIDVQRSFILQKVSKFLPDYIIIGDYISKKDALSVLSCIGKKKIFYNNESFHNNFKYYRPNFLLDYVISFSGSKSFYYPLIADFIKSFQYDLVLPNNNRAISTCLIASNLNKINKYNAEIRFYENCKIYGKYNNNTLFYESTDPYESIHKSAILTTSNHISALAIENSFQNGYFTEKIIFPLLSRTVPIFIGSKSIKNFIKKEYFLFHYELTNLNYNQRNKLIFKIYDKLQIQNNIYSFFTNCFLDYLNFLDNSFFEIGKLKLSILKSQYFRRILI